MIKRPTTVPWGLPLVTLCAGFICFPLIIQSMICTTTYCGIARKVCSGFWIPLITPNFHLSCVTRPHELCRTVAWRCHQSVAMFNLNLVFDVHNIRPQNSPHNLCVTSRKIALSTSRNFFLLSLLPGHAQSSANVHSWIKYFAPPLDIPNLAPNDRNL